MTKKGKKIYKIYRRYEEDVWGDLFKRGMDYKLSNFFSFVLDKRANLRKPRFVFDAGITEIRRDLKKHKVKTLFYLEKQKLKRFYGDLSEQEFKQIANAVTYKRRRREQEYTFVLGLENRLDTLAYRFHLAINVKEGKKFIHEGWIKVDGKVIKAHNHRIKKNNIITFSYPEIVLYYWRLKFGKGKPFKPYPDYFWVSLYYMIFKYNPTPYPRVKIKYPYPIRFAEAMTTYY